MNVLRNLLNLLASMGPAPAAKGDAAPKAKGPAEAREGTRGVFDGDEPAGDEPDDLSKDTTQDGDGDEPAGDGDEGDRDQRDLDAPDEEEDEEEDGDEEDGDDDDDSDESDDDDEDDDAADLRDTWETRLSTEAAASGGNKGITLNLDGVSITKAVRDRVLSDRKANDGENADPEKDLDGIAQIAEDVVLQVLGRYHQQVAAPRGDTMEKAVRNVSVGRALSDFRSSMGEALTPKVEARMAEVYTSLATKHGWRAADKVPLKALFRMAGGKKGKAGKKPAKEPKPADDKNRRDKHEALDASDSGGRTIGRTRPEGKKPPKDKALHEFAGDVRGHSPFFRLGRK